MIVNDLSGKLQAFQMPSDYLSFQAKMKVDICPI